MHTNLSRHRLRWSADPDEDSRLGRRPHDRLAWLALRRVTQDHGAGLMFGPLDAP